MRLNLPKPRPPSDIIAVVQAVQAVQKATQRIPQPQRPGVTFYSELDTWLFVARADTKVCPTCLMYETWSDVMGGIRGDQLRTEFPYHTIQDEMTIMGPDEDGRGLVHPNCRCYLTRVIGTARDQVMRKLRAMGYM